MPERIRLQRKRGWRKPEGAIVVARPTKWGNHWRIVVDGRWYRVRHVTEDRSIGSFLVPEFAYNTAARQFYSDLVNDRLPYTVADVERELGGHDLCCWCPPNTVLPKFRGPLNMLCHADVLLELANQEAH